MVVGAPKCGTTSLFHSLNEREELSFLGKDSHLLGKDLNLPQRDHSIDIEAVLSQFDKETMIGDVSVWYLFSRSAAKEIHQLNPEAKIIICLRNPLEMIPSLHHQHMKGGDESISDLNLALTRDFNDESIDKGVHFHTRPRYLDAVDYSNQISRYQQLFKAVHFVFYSDLKNNFGATINEIELFLGIEPRDKVAIVASNKRQHISKPGLIKVMKKKPAFLKSVFRIAIPSRKLRHKIMEKAANASYSDQSTNKIVSLNPENRAIIVQFIEKQLHF